VTVHDLTLDATDDPGVLRLSVRCSSGTYVRTLAADLGRLLGGGAHLRALRRTAIGSFGEAEAAPVETAPLLAPAEAMRDLTRADVDAATADLVLHGRLLPAFAGDPPWAVVGPDGALLAVYEPRGGGAKPAVVVASAAT
jgi:tRNA pseudouridine55 synthase